ncbi:MAG TPA: type VI secretion system tip protein TssI/VgrG [Polyangium sp.]|nr:type VI secretion system tip protein TssI/VgrG [Polyangium sp.]
MSEPHIRVLPALSVEGHIFRVLQYELVEALSEQAFVECDVYDEKVALPLPQNIVGQKARLTLKRSNDVEERAFAGTIISAEMTPDEDDVPCLRLRIESDLYRLARRSNCRIFQEKSGVDIVKEVFKDAGITEGRQEWILSEDHPVRNYTAQYRETDWDFVQRILYEEGIYHAVRAGDDAETFVFSDHPDGVGVIEGSSFLKYIDEFGFDGGVDRVMRVSHTNSIRSDKVHMRNYDPERPSFTLEAKDESKDEGEHSLEIYEYPARTTDDAEVKRRTKILLESVQAGRDIIEGQTGSLALLPGLKFSILGHPYDPLNQELLVTELRITGSDPRQFQGKPDRPSKYVCEFKGVPTEKTNYRPPRRERGASVMGTQTAVTTGSSGSEIHVDKSGNVKVSFHWDRSGKTDDTSSRWVRTSQLTLGGSMLLPRVGWEVSVNFNNDVDEPYVMGRMYNTLTPPPYGLPGASMRSALQTATSPGGGSSNEMRMHDTKGAEEVFFNASRDASTHVKNNATESVGNNYQKKVGNNLSQDVTNSVTVNVGSNQSVSVGGNQSIKVETYQVEEIAGDHQLNIGGNRDLRVGGDHKVDVGADSKRNTGSNHIDLVVGAVAHNTLANLDHKIGSALVELAIGSRVINVGTSRTETAGLIKLAAVKGGRGVEIGGSLDVKAIGAVANLVTGDRSEKSGGPFTELAIGAQIAKAGGNVTFEADSLLTVIMGASLLSLTPASVAILGLSVKVDADVTDLSVLVIDN